MTQQQMERLLQERYEAEMRTQAEARYARQLELIRTALQNEAVDSGRRDSSLLRLNRVRYTRPLPPSSVRILFNGTITWAPARGIDPSGVAPTHWRVYAGTDADSGLVREIPYGQLFLDDNIKGDRIWVSAYSRPMDLESPRVLAGTDGGATGPGTDWYPMRLVYRNWVLEGNNSTIVSEPSRETWFLYIRLTQDNVGNGIFSWNETQFAPVTNQISPDADSVSNFTFIGLGGRWQCIGFMTGLANNWPA